MIDGFTMVLFIRYKEDLVALLVDEAHCVKLWGERFRAAFSELGTLRSLIPSEVNINSHSNSHNQNLS